MVLTHTYDANLLEKNKLLHNKITETYGKLIQLSEKERQAISRFARISNIGSSTRIENALLTDSEIDWIDTILTADGHITAFDKNRMMIENKLSKDRERSIEEVAGCRNMLMHIYEHANQFIPLRESDIRSLHAELMMPFVKDSMFAGNYKTQPNYVVERNNITGKTNIVFQTADAGPITEAAMSDLIKWYNIEMQQNPWSILIVSEFVYRFLAIHPFQDGNGRLGRGLFLLGFMQSSDLALSTLAKYLAIDRQIERHKEEYYFVLNACSQGKFSQNPGDYKISYFINFMLKMVSLALDDIVIYQNKYNAVQNLSPTATKIYQCFKEHPEIRLTTKEIIYLTSLPRRSIVHSLKTLFENGLIQKYGQGAGVRYQLTF